MGVSTSAVTLVPTDVAALAVGVSHATVRDWRRRGLLEAKGGTMRRPLYDLWAVLATDATVDEHGALIAEPQGCP